MQIKSFGTLLIVIGIFLSFLLFVISGWSPEFDFISNIRYAEIIQHYLLLGQALLLPAFIVSIGILFNREVFDSKSLTKLIPFLSDVKLN
jgi:hypothetical protein